MPSIVPAFGFSSANVYLLGLAPGLLELLFTLDLFGKLVIKLWQQLLLAQAPSTKQLRRMTKCP